MKLITLNTWCGKVYEPLEKFITEQAKDTDIFCFQEVRNGKYIGKQDGEVEELFNKIKNMLPDFKGYYSEMTPGIGMASFVKKTITIIKVDSFEILSLEDVKNVIIDQNQKSHPRIMQVISLDNPKISIFNFHGVAGGSSLKKDTLERDLQTKRILEILNKNTDPKILVGDFNLNPDTKAIASFEQQMNNLIKESVYKTTRSSFYDKKEIMPFADYIFTSKDLEVKNFKVWPDEVSDHLALSVET